jgi:hypothetical protein
MVSGFWNVVDEQFARFPSALEEIIFSPIRPIDDSISDDVSGI